MPWQQKLFLYTSSTKTTLHNSSLIQEIDAPYYSVKNIIVIFGSFDFGWDYTTFQSPSVIVTSSFSKIEKYSVNKWTLEVWYFSIIGMATLLHLFLKQTYSYWNRKRTQIATNINNFFFKYVVECVDKMYKKNRKNRTIFWKLHPLLLLRDKELIQSILIKDFTYFIDRTRTTIPYRQVCLQSVEKMVSLRSAPFRVAWESL